MGQEEPARRSQAVADGLTPIDPLRDGPVQALRASADIVQHEREQVPQCPICDDAGWLGDNVPFGHPHFGVLFPCICKQAEQARQQADELARLSHLQAFRTKTFATFNPFVPGLRVVVPQVKRYAKYPDGWLTLFGPYGVGKTHLAAAIANDVLERGEHVHFAVVPDLLDHLRATFGPQSTVGYDQCFEQVRTVPLLVLDDLGTENTTLWAREKLYQLLNYRYNYRLATVLTTNLKPESLDLRIYSRLCDPACGATLSIAASDYRRRTTQGKQ